tara:strand:+ start:640 stop:843 length:204 start_codon:yes stop_codon:yes gene_type:complete
MSELDPANKALVEIEAHERECRLRYEAIEESLERGSKRFDKLENMIWGIYGALIAAVIFPQVLKLVT